MQKVILNKCRIVRIFLAELWIRSPWSLRLALFWEPAKLLRSKESLVLLLIMMMLMMTIKQSQICSTITEKLQQCTDPTEKLTTEYNLHSTISIIHSTIIFIHSTISFIHDEYYPKNYRQLNTAQSSHAESSILNTCRVRKCFAE
jgi:ABC-type enterochelin transport system permease subunit